MYLILQLSAQYVYIEFVWRRGEDERVTEVKCSGV